MYTCIKTVLCPTVVFSVKVATSQSFLPLKRYKIKKIEIEKIKKSRVIIFPALFWIEKVILNAAGSGPEKDLRP